LELTARQIGPSAFFAGSGHPRLQQGLRTVHMRLTNGAGSETPPAPSAAASHRSAAFAAHIADAQSGARVIVARGRFQRANQGRAGRLGTCRSVGARRLVDDLSALRQCRRRRSTFLNRQCAGSRLMGGVRLHKRRPRSDTRDKGLWASITVRSMLEPRRAGRVAQTPLRQRRFAFGDEWQLRQIQERPACGPNPTWLSGIGIQRLDPVRKSGPLPEIQCAIGDRGLRPALRRTDAPECHRPQGRGVRQQPFNHPRRNRGQS